MNKHDIDLRRALERALRQDSRAVMVLDNESYFWKVPAIWLKEDIDKAKLKGKELFELFNREEDSQKLP